MSGGRTARARFLRGMLVGLLLFAAFVLVLLFAGELSSSKFLYVDF